MEELETEEIILTKDGLEKMEAELEELKTTVRTEIAERIRIALGYGDLKENSEYDDAKKAYSNNEDRILEIENKLRRVKLIDESEIDSKIVQIGNTVTVYDEEFDEEITYTIVGHTEVDLENNKISNESPIGQALLGAKKNQTVVAETPTGEIKFKILKIAK